jgi:cell fate regulator YaaT (PSP1 superfamily)
MIDIPETTDIPDIPPDITPEAMPELSESAAPEYIEVEFRSGRLGYCVPPTAFDISPDDWLVIQVERGNDIARVIHIGVSEIPGDAKDRCDLHILRLANEQDMTKLDTVEENESQAAERFRQLVVKYPFEMKLINTVYQFDGNKLTFFFTADGRVDFREFVRELASVFRTRIELHQTTGRDVAKQIGGIGMCGCDYCCSTFLKQFNQITIKMAKDQNLSGNLSKISGPCGRLLCCLHFEEGMYCDNSCEFPEIGEEVRIRDAKFIVVKNDYYNKKIHLSGEDETIEMMELEEFRKLRPRGKSRS